MVVDIMHEEIREEELDDDQITFELEDGWSAEIMEEELLDTPVVTCRNISATDA